MSPLRAAGSPAAPTSPPDASAGTPLSETSLLSPASTTSRAASTAHPTSPRTPRPHVRVTEGLSCEIAVRWDGRVREGLACEIAVRWNGDIVLCSVEVGMRGVFRCCRLSRRCRVWVCITDTGNRWSPVGVCLCDGRCHTLSWHGSLLVASLRHHAVTIVVMYYRC